MTPRLDYCEEDDLPNGSVWVKVKCLQTTMCRGGPCADMLVILGPEVMNFFRVEVRSMHPGVENVRFPYTFEPTSLTAEDRFEEVKDHVFGCISLMFREPQSDYECPER
jgi:hypothetical protein